MKPRRFTPFGRPVTIAVVAGVCGVIVAAAAPVLADDDAERAREQVEAGRYVPLEDIIRAARERYPGRVVEVELDDDDDEYEIEILQDDGTKVELEYDALTGKLLEVDVDDD